MADIKFSDGCVAYFMSQALASPSNGFKDTLTRFYLMEGTIPTQGELDAANSNFRSSDRLWYLNAQIGGITTYVDNVLTLAYHEAAAAATGTATWFYWDADYNQSGTANVMRLAGTVSGIGGGGDLEITTTSLVSGVVYGAGPIVNTFPQTYTYS